jgi:hypothetical protein
MSHTPENDRTSRQDEKVHSPGGPSNTTTTITATTSTSIGVNLEEQIVTQLADQSAQPTSNEEDKKDGEKKRPASEVSGGVEQADEPAKKVKIVVAAETLNTTGDPATPSTILGQTVGGGRKLRRPRDNSRRVHDVSWKIQFPSHCNTSS